LDYDNLKKALQKTKDSQVNFIIITGDLTSLGEKENLIKVKKILDESEIEYYAVPGNHDIWWGRKFKQDIWGEVFGKSYQSFKKSNQKFILINNADGENGLDGTYGTKKEVQQNWLKDELKECLFVDCLVFMHIPINHPSSIYVMGQDNSLVASQAAELKKLFIENKVKQVFAGHLHFSSAYEFEGLKTTIIGAITSERNFQSPKFLQVEIKKDGLKAEEAYLD